MDRKNWKLRNIIGTGIGTGTLLAAVLWWYGSVLPENRTAADVEGTSIAATEVNDAISVPASAAKSLRTAGEPASVPSLTTELPGVADAAVVEWVESGNRMWALVETAGHGRLFVAAERSGDIWQVERAAPLNEYLVYAEDLDVVRERLGAEARLRELGRVGSLVRVEVAANGLEQALVVEARLREVVGSERMDRNLLVQPTATPDDPGYAGSWELGKLGMEAVWEAYGFAPDNGLGRRPIITVVDNGAPENPDFHFWTNDGEIAGNGIDDDDNLYADDLQGYNFSRRSGDLSYAGGHGTTVSRIATAQTNNGYGTASPASHASLMRAIYYEDVGGTHFSAIEGMIYGISNGADVINCSFVSKSTMGFNQVFDAAEGTEAVIVAAAGNDGQDLANIGRYPADLTHPRVLSVGASDENDARATSNYSATQVDVFAPGSVTSYSTPLVSSVVALLKSVKPDATYEELIAAVIEGAEPVAALDGLCVSNGRLSAIGAVEALVGGLPDAGGGSDPEPQPEPEAPVVPELVVGTVSSDAVELSWSSAESVDGYVLEMSEAGGTYAMVDGALAADSTGTTVSGLMAETDYQFRLRSERDGLVSSWVESAVVTTPAAEVIDPEPSVIVVPEGVAVSNQLVEIVAPTGTTNEGREGIANVLADVANKTLWWSTEPVIYVTPMVDVEWLGYRTANDLPVRDPISVQVNDGTNVVEASFPVTDVRHSEVLMAQPFVLKAGTVYEVQLSTTGEADPWNNAYSQVEYFLIQPLDSGFYEAPVAPVLTVSSGQAETARLTWSSLEAVDGYELQVSVAGSAFAPADPSTLGGEVTTVTLQGLLGDAMHQFRIRSERNGVYSDWASSASILIESPQPGFYDVTAYGADGSDAADDTAAIAAALEAATLAGGEVHFPAGRYVVSPPGAAVVTVYEKESGAWILRDGPMEAGSSAAGWHFGNGAPESVSAVDGEQYLDLRGGLVYEQVGGNWVVDVELMAKAGNGWTAGHGEPALGDGVDGDVYLKFHVELDHINGAVFELHPRHNGIRFTGEGVGQSILSFQTWSGQDPMDYEVDVETKTIVRSAIPQDAEGRYRRGSLFVFKQIGDTEFNDIHWDGLEMRGNTTATGDDGWYTPYHDLQEWDISNKAIVFSFGAKPMHNLSVKNSSLHGWRGEILYKGGSNPAEILIENCDIYETNSSAVSISGNMILRNSRIWNTYNGVENYCDDGQFSEITGCEIDLGRKFAGEFGVVYLGSENAYLKLDNNVIRSAKGAVFFSDFAHNVEVTNNQIVDAQWGIYVKYMNLYNLPGSFNDVTITGNTFLAEEQELSFAILSAINGIPAKNWEVSGNTVVENGSEALYFLKENHEGPRSQRNVLLQNNHLPESVLFYGTGIVPEMNNNTAARLQFNTFACRDGLYFSCVANPEVELTFLGTTDLKLIVPELDRYPEGHQFRLTVTHGNLERGLSVEPGPWNNLESGFVLYKDASVSFEKQADGLFHLVDYVASPHVTEAVVSAGNVMDAKGLSSLSLLPTETTVYDSFVGFAVNVPVTVEVNEHVRLAANDFIVTPTGQTWDPDESAAVVMVKGEDGRLRLEGLAASEVEAPAAPEVRLSATGPGAIRLTWSSAEPVESYYLQVRDAVGNFVDAEPQAVFGADETSADFAGLDLTNGTTFRVRSIRYNQNSEWSLVATPRVPGGYVATPPTPDPSGPGGVMVETADGLPEPLHYWGMDAVENGNFVDAGTVGLDLSAAGMAIGAGIGSAGGSLDGNGTASGLVIPEADSVNRSVRSQYSVSLWVKVDADASGQSSVVYEQGDYWRGLNVVLDRGVLLASGWNRPGSESGWDGTTLSGGRLPVGQWNHVALVLDGGETVEDGALVLYVNGEAVASGAGSQLWAQGGGTAIGGTRYTTSFRDREVFGLDPFGGLIDDVSVWGAALSAAQIEELILVSFQ